MITMKSMTPGKFLSMKNEINLKKNFSVENALRSSVMFFAIKRKLCQRGRRKVRSPLCLFLFKTKFCSDCAGGSEQFHKFDSK